jgi:hypothetical protein
MNDYRLPIVCFIAASIVFAAHSQGVKTNYWHPDTKKLDQDMSMFHDPAMSDASKTLAHDVERFYELLRDKKWHETYELRAKAFRHDRAESDYIAEARRAGTRWALVNYDVLDGTFLHTSEGGSTNIDEAILICRFVELPGYAESYSTVFWHREDGVWKCLSAGPHKLNIFEGTRGPWIDWSTH